MHHRNDCLGARRRGDRPRRFTPDILWTAYGLAIAALTIAAPSAASPLLLVALVPLFWGTRKRQRSALEPFVLAFRGNAGTNLALAAVATGLVGVLATFLDLFGRLVPEHGSPVAWVGLASLALACLATVPVPVPLDGRSTASYEGTRAVHAGLASAVLVVLLLLATAGPTAAIEAGAAALGMLAVTHLALNDSRRVQLRERALRSLERSGLRLDGKVLDRAANVDLVLFHRSGILTCGTPAVTEVVSLSDDHGPEQVARIAAIAEFGSRHPLRDGILRHGQQQLGTIPAVKGFEAFPSLGVRAVLQGREVLCGNTGFLTKCGISREDIEEAQFRTRRLRERGDTVVWVVSDRTIIGAIALRDDLRPEAREACERLHSLGIAVGVLSGDAAASVGAQCDGLGEVRVLAGLDASEAAGEIEHLERDGWCVALVGAPEHAEATLRKAFVPIEWPGSDAARTEASTYVDSRVYLERADLSLVPLLLEATRTWRRRVQRAAWGGTITQVSAWVAVAGLAIVAPSYVAWFAALVRIVSEILGGGTVCRAREAVPRSDAERRDREEGFAARLAPESTSEMLGR